MAEAIAEANLDPSKRLKKIGIPDVFADQYGSKNTLLERYSITTAELISVIKDLQASRPHPLHGVKT